MPEAAKDVYRFGIGEWYGNSFIRLAPERRKEFAEIQALKKRDRPEQICPFRSSAYGVTIPCTKEGGVCSLRLYHKRPDTGEITIASGPMAALRTTCPARFVQNGTIFVWIGETILGHGKPHIVDEVGFLERPADEEAVKEGKQKRDDVGRIDNVLVHPTEQPMRWCAMEIQAVYFSGASMTREFEMLRKFEEPRLPFPGGHRRPDYRSSGPKRLMPQLQIKVPSLRRWGKKMAVVVDERFFAALGKMDNVRDVSNCDIAWFIVRYDESDGEAVLTPHEVRLTTLERAVEGLTGGYPVSLETSEARIRAKLSQPAAPPAIPDHDR